MCHEKFWRPGRLSTRLPGLCPCTTGCQGYSTLVLCLKELASALLCWACLEAKVAAWACQGCPTWGEPVSDTHVMVIAPLVVFSVIHARLLCKYECLNPTHWCKHSNWRLSADLGSQSWWWDCRGIVRAHLTSIWLAVILRSKRHVYCLP